MANRAGRARRGFRGRSRPALGAGALGLTLLLAVSCSDDDDDDGGVLTPPPLAMVTVIREATAVDPSGIQPAVDAFRDDLGEPLNGNAVGSQGAGRREITWDVSDADAAPARLPRDFFNAVAPRGVIIDGSPRLQIQVSADASNSSGTTPEFGNINATYPAAFRPFSGARLFCALNDTTVDVSFYVPGTAERATVSGFGAVFTDVDVSGGSKLEYFDIYDRLIFSREVLATPGNESLSFLGVLFEGAPVSRVRVTMGLSSVGPNDITQDGVDVVVLDDFIYGEPQPE